MANEYWHEDSLQDGLLTLLCRDRKFLKTFATQLKARDFRAVQGESNSREVIAGLALAHWTKYREPIGGLLKSEVLEYIETNKKDEKGKRTTFNKKELVTVLETILKGDRLAPAEAMEDKVRKYLERKFMAHAVDEIISQQEDGTLTKRKFNEICKGVTDFNSKHKLATINIASKTALEDRIARRSKESNSSRPFLLIDGIDEKTKCVGRGDLGLWVGPQKSGKSFGLNHTATAYARQRLKSIYITLEDPSQEAEDRFDASWSGIDINRLGMLPNKLRRRFKKFARRIDSHIQLIDGTEEAVTIADIEEVYLRLRDQGFLADAIFVDYDEYLKPVKQYQKKQDGINEVYIDYRRFLAKYSLIGWTAAQTQRLKENTHVITANMTADDIGKIRKATMAIGIGYGRYGPDWRYLQVMAHKRGRMNFGTDICTALARGSFYDRERTLSELPSKRKVKA